jgi:transposase
MHRRARKVELFEEIRREYEFGNRSVRAIAKKLGVHRRMVRQALGSAVPPERKTAQRKRPKLGPYLPFIDGILDSDRKAPRKQRHTAHRIYIRVIEEVPQCDISEVTVRRYVRNKKEEMGLLRRETFVPQAYEWGVEAQVDWYEAYADLEGERQKVQVFGMRSMASGGAFHRAYPRATQQAFLEAHEHAFAYFGGVFKVVRYDNLSSAVKKILRGREREESARFVAFRSHWRYQAEFCTPAAGHEKGGIEGEAGYFRRNHWVPVPEAADLDGLNEQLLVSCGRDEQRMIGDRSQTVGAGMLIEREHLLGMAENGFDLAEESFPIVDKLGCVRVKSNWYSAPLKAGTKVRAKTYAATIEIWQQGQRVARHPRCYGAGQQILDLEHYLEVLDRKPGALAGSRPLKQWREQGRWPESYDTLLHKLIERHGKQNGTREMIELLKLGRQHGYKRLEETVGMALELGCWDGAAVRYLMAEQMLDRSRPGPIEVGALLARYERVLPVITGYDELLGTSAQREVTR